MCVLVHADAPHTLRHACMQMLTANGRETSPAEAWPAESADQLLCFLLHTCDVANQARPATSLCSLEVCLNAGVDLLDPVCFSGVAKQLL